MPRPRPAEFRRRAVELARMKDNPVAQIAADLGIFDSCLRGWSKKAEVPMDFRMTACVSQGGRQLAHRWH